jgi:hypothetical protein
VTWKRREKRRVWKKRKEKKMEKGRDEKRDETKRKQNTTNFGENKLPTKIKKGISLTCIEDG